MRYAKVCIESIGYELAPIVVSSALLEDRIAPVYKALHITAGQISALTGIRERRFWNVGQRMSDGALAAAQKALTQANVEASELGAVVYCGVCRDNLEPATACAVAAGLGVQASCVVQDISNACLGVLSGIIDVANRIELGQIKAGLVVSCESSREINDIMIQKLIAHPSMELFRVSLATLTGGSGAVAVLLTDSELSLSQHRLMTHAIRCAPEHHKICRWGPDPGISAHATIMTHATMTMETDAPAVLTHGVKLGRETWKDFLESSRWSVSQVDKVICHQVTAGHRAAILGSLEIPLNRDFSTFETLGNIGTVSLPLTLAMADERAFLKSGDRVALLGIGSGLNCMMLGVEW